MAEPTTKGGAQAQKESPRSTEQERSRGLSPQRGEPSMAQRDRGTLGFGSNPFELMRRMTDEMDRMFGWPFGRGLFGGLPGFGEQTAWAPRIEAFQRGDKYVVRAELPGLKKDDVDVEVSEEALTIRGERKQEQQEEREGLYHSECSYGSFFRRVPLPEGVITDNAQASFRDGILEITLDAPPSEVSRGRRLEIREGK